MNAAHKEKFKHFVLKMPFGAGLLKLRQKIKHWASDVRKQRKIRYQRKLKLKYNPEIRKLYNPSEYRFRSIKTLQNFESYSNVPVNQATAFEIGTGKYLMAPIGLSLLGFQKVITTDIQRIAVPEYVQDVIKYYRKHAKQFGIVNCPKIKEKVSDDNLDDFLLRNFKIEYRAPYDTAHIDLPDNSVDFVFAHSVFEHVHADLLPSIVRESFRILRGGGILYTHIDFKDHRAYSNPKLTIYDYLQYSAVEWLKIDKNKNQNRLRTADHLALLVAAGFEVVNVEQKEISWADRAAFATLKVADEFKKRYTDEELMEKGVGIVLRKP